MYVRPMPKQEDASKPTSSPQDEPKASLPPPPPPPPGPPAPATSSSTSEKPAVAGPKLDLAAQLARFRVAPTIGAAKENPVYINLRSESPRASAPPFPCQGHARIVAVSDTHLHHERLRVPDGHILIVTGDFTNDGNRDEVSMFNLWLGKLPHQFKVVICGNHEEGLARLTPAEIRNRLPNATHYLHDSSAEIMGFRFYGTPYVPNMGGQSNEPSMKAYDDKFFYRNESNLRGEWAKIPRDTQVLLTHTPPKGVLDNGLGCPALTERLEQLPQLLYHQFGHVHLCPGYMLPVNEEGGTKQCNPLSVNAAMDDTQQPFYFDLPLAT